MEQKILKSDLTDFLAVTGGAKTAPPPNGPAQARGGESKGGHSQDILQGGDTAKGMR